MSRVERSGLVSMLAIGFVAATGQVLAGPISTAVIERNAQGEWVERLVDSGYNAPATGAVENYDNWRSPDFGDGQTQFFSDLRIGGNEVGDDLALSGPVGNIVDSLGISRVNMSTQGSMGDFRLTLRWYRQSTLEIISTFSFVARGIPIGPGERRRSFFSEGMLISFNLGIENEVYMTQQFTEVGGIDLADVGLMVGGPINTGASTSVIRNFSTGEMFDLGDSPQANLGLFVKTIPNPGAICVICVATVLWPARRIRK